VRAVLADLATLYGDGALERGRALAKVVPGAAAPLQEVEAAIRAAARRRAGPFAVDLGEARGLGYYTGITFAGHAPGAGSAVAAGGRYDGLLARFGRPGPAIGFAVDLEFATQALERTTGRGRARAGASAGRAARGARPR
jgi:ATP phosphoribosyltransferase regulatory subunit